MALTQVPEVDTAVRSLTVMWDGSLVVAANNKGTCYVWRLLRGTQVSSFMPVLVNRRCGTFNPLINMGWISSVQIQKLCIKWVKPVANCIKCYLIF